ncbi:hypothetical protein [Streptomyces sp. GESEQ-35]|uniref:hypothetical protein n=1 Tax=Streptomyces sp. GESEQ-35 TaxID=2812657 RepID=UPI0024A71731|nr:hypothetical protein [Streptomyces sp. GESEQ-35]
MSMSQAAIRLSTISSAVTTCAVAAATSAGAITGAVRSCASTKAISASILGGRVGAMSKGTQAGHAMVSSRTPKSG